MSDQTENTQFSQTGHVVKTEKLVEFENYFKVNLKPNIVSNINVI